MRYHNIKNNDNLDDSFLGLTMNVFVIILFLWILAGVVAFVLSIVCITKNGSFLNKFIGFLIAILFGPFYFLFYGLNKSYCY
jgi:hypothetical protein